MSMCQNVHVSMCLCVQAALGSLVLDAARELDLEDADTEADAEEVGEMILTLAVLAILVTAPIGAVGIFVTGPRWLEQEKEGGRQEQEQEGDVNVDGDNACTSSGGVNCKGDI